ncbi:histone acetylation protein-domain-containing protein [Coemansia spiralis]|nr:histone acetylation protein-domain-containing protein [Coemansia spiralis]
MTSGEHKSYLNQDHELPVITQDISESLRQELLAGTSLVLRVIQTSDQPVDSLTPRRHHSHYHASNTLARRILILVSQNNCFVAGLEAYEFVSLSVDIFADLGSGQQQKQQLYKARGPEIAVDVCIQKLDTTGELSKRMPLARVLVSGYLRSLRRYKAALNVPSVGIHLFARAQPEYLFAKSQKNPGKHILGDLALIKWWQNTVQFALTYAKPAAQHNTSNGLDRGDSTSATAYCVIPGSAASEATWFLGRCDGNDNSNMKLPVECSKQQNQQNTFSASPSVRWIWGLPYIGSVRAHDCVLQFPDDPITRLLAEPHSDLWSVAMLLEMLSVSEECGSGHRTAYFSASLPLAPTASTSSPPLPARRIATADQGSISFEDYDNVLIALFDHEMDFSNTKAALASSARLAEVLDSKHSIPVVSIETAGTSIKPKYDASISENATGAATTPKINDLTMVIRKKRKVAK